MKCKTKVDIKRIQILHSNYSFLWIFFCWKNIWICCKIQDKLEICRVLSKFVWFNDVMTLLMNFLWICWRISVDYGIWKWAKYLRAKWNWWFVSLTSLWWRFVIECGFLFSGSWNISWKIVIILFILTCRYDRFGCFKIFSFLVKWKIKKYYSDKNSVWK